MSRFLFTTGYMMISIFSMTCGYAQQPAFPGADGWGKFASGGRGGEVIEVTNLYDSGEGSLRAAINVSGARTIVFSVSGTIFLNSDLKISKGDLTIAGQTAPGDGICLANYPLKIEATNVIVRYLRSRLGDKSGQEEDALFVRYADSVIIDHCSFGWSVDEAASAYSNSHFTMQYCIISESLYHSIHSKGEHGYGGIWGGHKASFHHNLLAHHTSRLPRFNGARYNASWDELVDHRNNVIYNWGFNNAYGGEPSEIDGSIARINVVKNYYKAGPATRPGELQFRILSPDADPVYGFSRWHVDSNGVAGYPLVLEDNWGLGVQGVSEAEKQLMRSDTLFPYVMDAEENVSFAYARVLSEAGARLPRRDTLDKRIIWEVANDTAIFGGTYGEHSGIIDSQDEVGGWPELYSAPAPPDTDHDGMPDQWETDHGLNPYDPADRNEEDFGNGYTNLEEYLNGIEEFGDFLRPPTALKLDLAGLNHVLLDWQDNSDREAGFFIERADSGDFYLLDTLPSDSISYADSNLVYETTFSYRIRAFTDGDTSAYTNVRSITTLAEWSPPLIASQPSPAHYENDVSVSPVLSWKPGSGTEYHRVYFGTTNPPDLVGEQTDNEYLPGMLEHSTSYYWRIDEVNTNGTATGQVWKFITEASTSVEQVSDRHDMLPFDIYPNPVTSRIATIEFRLSEAAEISISLYDIFGRRVKADYLGHYLQGLHRHELHLDEFPSGTYLLMIHTGWSKTVKSIILLE
jgi:pectate lyase